MRGLYVHIPFCDAICHYCDFVKHVSKGHAHNMKYLEALKNEIQSYYAKYPHVDTIYIGGGTPSALNHEELTFLLEALSMYHPIEYTIEVNPESYDHEKGIIMKAYGINRVSLGVQTFNQKHLERLNRKHTNQMVFDAIASLKSLGITNLNVDLIYALEHQTVEELHHDIDTLISLDIPHVSAYSLIIEEKTFFSHQLKRNKFVKTDEDTEATMYDIVIDRFKDAGYDHYEISNFEKHGKTSLHNTLYWTLQDYIGVGLGAHGFIDKKRTYNHKAMSKYIIDPLKEVIEQDEETLRNDHLLFKLRMTQGIDLNMVKSKYKDDIFNLYPSLLRFIDDGLLMIEDNHLKLTRRGLQLGNLVFMVFI
ncbi:MAG TPA: coproporphyrinogen III oxidase [Acholeplasmataceae bacterium]|nr:coproporphyrinogen III oxidase [Acholeplasmataceae bacterium]